MVQYHGQNAVDYTLTLMNIVSTHKIRFVVENYTKNQCNASLVIIWFIYEDFIKYFVYIYRAIVYR